MKSMLNYWILVAKITYRCWFLASYFDKSQCYKDWQILPNCLYLVAHGPSKPTVCVEGMHKSCAALTLHTGVLSKTFAIKSCRNHARHIFSWLPGEVVGLHTGVLTKTFAMSVLYLKSELNCGLGAINGDDASKAGGHGSQRARSCYLLSTALVFPWRGKGDAVK